MDTYKEFLAKPETQKLLQDTFDGLLRTLTIREFFNQKLESLQKEVEEKRNEVARLDYRIKKKNKELDNLAKQVIERLESAGEVK